MFEPRSIDVEFDDSLFLSTLPPVMEVGRPYTVWIGFRNNGSSSGEFYLVVWAESSAVHPLISNEAFDLRSGEAAKANFTLVGVKPTEDPQTIRAMILASPIEGAGPMKIGEATGEVLRVERSTLSLPIILLFSALVVGIAILGIRSWASTARKRSS